ncbi:DUF3576 domain-containing protein [Paracoccaceae bacterium GXU_MW_L88]
MPAPLRLIPLALVAALGLAACNPDRDAQIEEQRQNVPDYARDDSPGLLDLFTNQSDANREINVNKFIWQASLDTLSFLPLETADPFAGVFTTGWGRAPGSSQLYRATVYVTGPALDARSLKVSVQRAAGGGGVPASAETTRQIEDAILTRARQLRIASQGR